MKRWYQMFLLIFLLSRCLAATQSVVNVFTWTNYIPDAAIQAFEKSTGIHVNLSSYNSNEDLYAKLKADPEAGYDVIIPSSYYVSKMRQEGMLRPLNHRLIPNHRDIDPSLLNKSFDPHNLYSYPYMWGSTGIAVDKRFWNPKSIHRWSDLWQKRFRNQLLMYDDSREVFSAALLAAGHSINTQNLVKIREAYHALLRLMPNLRLFSTDAAINVYSDDDVTIGMAGSGDFVMARQENPNLVFIYPQDGFAMWEDCFAVPRYAPHFRNAMRFINFMMRPEVGKMILLWNGYASPNMKTKALLPKAMQQDPVRYPSAQILKRGQMEDNVGSATSVYLHYWTLLKLV